jgi:hypothetical protein
LQAANLWTLEPTTKETIRALAPDELLDFIDALVDDGQHGDE